MIGKFPLVGSNEIKVCIQLFSYYDLVLYNKEMSYLSNVLMEYVGVFHIQVCFPTFCVKGQKLDAAIECKRKKILSLAMLFEQDRTIKTMASRVSLFVSVQTIKNAYIQITINEEWYSSQQRVTPITGSDKYYPLFPVISECFVA